MGEERRKIISGWVSKGLFPPVTTNTWKNYNDSVRFLVHCWFIRILGITDKETVEFYIHGFVHRDSVSTRSNEMQQYASVYLLQNYSTCSGCDSNNLPPAWPNIRPRWRKVVALTRDMICTRGCSYSLMYSWWWVRQQQPSASVA